MEHRYEYRGRPSNPLRVALAFANVVRDLSNTEDAVIVELAYLNSRIGDRISRWDDVVRNLRDRPRATKAIAARRRLSYVDVDALSRLPAGTLGRVVAERARAKGINPNIIEPQPDRDDASYLKAHLFETHDLWHTVAGFGFDNLGEFGLTGFYVAQLGRAPFFSFLLSIGFLNSAFFSPEELPDRVAALSEGYRAGLRADSLVGVDWDSMWERPLAEIRREFGIEGATERPGEGIPFAAATA